MKNNMPLNKIVPFIEEKLHVKFDSLKNVKGTVIRKGLTEIAIDPQEEMTVLVKVSSINVDRSGEVVIPEGVITDDFLKNPVICWQHDYSIPANGKCVAIQKTKDAVYAKITFGSTERCKEIWELVKDKIINAMSIGYVELETLVKGTRAFNEYVKTKLEGVIDNIDQIQKIITKSTLLEISWVNIPCNQDALVQYVSTKQLSDDFIKFLGVKQIKEEVDMPQNAGSTLEESFPESNEPAMPDTQEMCKACGKPKKECTCENSTEVKAEIPETIPEPINGKAEIPETVPEPINGKESEESEESEEAIDDNPVIHAEICECKECMDKKAKEGEQDANNKANKANNQKVTEVIEAQGGSVQDNGSGSKIIEVETLEKPYWNVISEPVEELVTKELEVLDKKKRGRIK